MCSFISVISFLLVGALFALATPSKSRLYGRQELPVGPAQASSRDCHHVMVLAEQGVKIFSASEVFNCLKKVPFDPAVAARFIDFYNHTLQYQSTLALLADPPADYQQPAVDVRQVLTEIKANITARRYMSQYHFEAELQLLVNRMHDSHVVLDAGILSAFSFASPYGLVSVSVDGKKEPEVFLSDDVRKARFQKWKPSPITMINGQNVSDFLSRFAELHSVGYLEPHADWNALMDSPVADVQGNVNVFQQATFYPGNELNFTLANTTTVEAWWWALYRYHSRTGPLSTAGDFFNYFVLGLGPNGFDPDKPTDWWPQEETVNATSEWDDEDFAPHPDWGCSDSNTRPNWCSQSRGAYPDDPVVSQQDLNTTGTGVVTGYILEDIKTGVLSIPSFLQFNDDVHGFYVAVKEFIANAKEHQTKHIIIDLQQNDGGDVLLALTTFSQFFGGLKPYTGSRIRSHELANILGSAYTEWWKKLKPGTGEDDVDDEEYEAFADSEWIIAHHINAETGANFSSWDEYSGPVLDRGDKFSRTQLYNLSDKIFDAAAFGWVPEAYTQPNVTAPPQIWAPSDIVILTDGLCSSACAFFVELMAHQAGVRTIVVGGRPAAGPMQTASGNRGALIYSADALNLDYVWLNDTIKDSEAYSRLPPPSVWNDTGMWVNDASFNIRDNIRVNDTIPLQFKYDAAQCRIYYTLANVYNMTQLWRDAAAATWTDPSLCVQGSTGYAQGPHITPSKSPPERIGQAPSLDLREIDDIGFYVNSTGGLVASRTLVDSNNLLPLKCSSAGSCVTGYTCQNLAVSCPAGVSGKPKVPVCAKRCSSGSSNACLPLYASDSKRNTPKKSSSLADESLMLYDGYLYPGPLDPRHYDVKCTL